MVYAIFFKYDALRIAAVGHLNKKRTLLLHQLGSLYTSLCSCYILCLFQKVRSALETRPYV